MGFQDRDYYRDATRGSGWLSGAAPACKALIFVNIAVFIAEVVFDDAHLSRYFAASSTDIFRRGHVWQLLTAPFLHDDGNPFHIIWNMLFLWMAGREVESLYGSREFTVMYLAAGVVSTLCWALIDAFALGGLAREGRIEMLGASGAVMAVVVIYTLYNPRREVLLFFVFPVEMWLLLVIYLGCDFFFLMQQLNGVPSRMGVAFAGHLGGAAFGYLYKTAAVRLSSFLEFRINRRRTVPRLRVVKPDLYDRDLDTAPSPKLSGTPSSRPSAGVSDEQFEARLDEVLAKVGREGRGGLTEEEKGILQEASRRARDRRGDRVR